MPENDFSYTIVTLKSHGFFWVTFTGEISNSQLEYGLGRMMDGLTGVLNARFGQC
jgi:hypothetical protein